MKKKANHITNNTYWWFSFLPIDSLWIKYNFPHLFKTKKKLILGEGNEKIVGRPLSGWYKSC